jgi:hypothetical protein
MNWYFVLKMVVPTGYEPKDRIRSAIVIPQGEKRRICIYGNIPDLFHGMTIGAELDGGKVVDYCVEPTDKNIAALEKAGVNPEQYGRKLEIHQTLKQEGYNWDVASTRAEEIYNVLPFPDADKVHKEMVDNAEAVERTQALGREVIRCARRKRKIAYKVDEYLSYFNEVEQEGAYEQLMYSLKIMCLQASGYGFGSGMVWDNELKEKEEFVRQDIEERKQQEYELLTKDEIQAYIDKIKDSTLEQEQIDTLWSLRTSLPCIITGGAGVGKTTVIQNIIECYSMHYKKKNVLLIAPTGKAARRLAEKTKMPATTIHGALRKVPDDDYVFYNSKNLLPYRLIIVDESSMVDTSLMYDLLSAVEKSSKIIFVGDHNQLYPVGYGEPFFDFMKTLGVYRLTINHRQAEGTDILNNAKNALAGMPLECGRGVTVRHISFMEIGDLLTRDEDTQIISPYNDLNRQINAFLRKGEEQLNEGDKIMTIRNTKSYCNGDIGTVVSANSKGVTIEIEGKRIVVKNSHRKDITLAYAITVHKMQGSEAKRVMVFLPENDSMVDKRLLYTAVTRAREELEVYYYTNPMEE